MQKRILAVVLIFMCTSIAWFILGGATTARTHTQDMKLKSAVGQLWGTEQKQNAPHVWYRTYEEKKVKTVRDDETVEETRTVSKDFPVDIESSDISVDIELHHRKKGLLWYATYAISYHALYRIQNRTEYAREYFFTYEFPTENGVYDDFLFAVAGARKPETKPVAGAITESFTVAAGEGKSVEISYTSQGMDEWWYVFGSGVSHIRNFRLLMNTDFSDIDFPETSMAPTSKQKTDRGWQLVWEYDDLISGIQLGMVMPLRVNPGPFVSRVTFFAPVALFLFLFLMLIITTLKQVRIHAMNYFFICAAFFSFHLLMAYLSDHVDIHVALIVSSAVSIFLVVTYMRLVTGMRFALVETGISQFVYLVFFSYTFFLEGYTGLVITVLCIVTLFIVMQMTGRIDWGKQFAKEK